MHIMISNRIQHYLLCVESFFSACLSQNITLLNTSTARIKNFIKLLGHVLLRLCSRAETMAIQKYFSVHFTSQEL